MVASPRGFGATSEFDNPLSSRYSLTESLTVFDDVFVPWERVFLCGEWRYAGALAKTFVEFHRFTAVSYKTPLLELLLGSAALIADYHGLLGAAHVRDKLARLIMYLHTGRGLTTAAASECRIAEGIAVPNPIHDERREVSVRARLPRRGAGRAGSRRGSDRDRARGRGLGGARGPRADRAVPRGAGGIGAEDHLRVTNLIRDLVASDLGGYLEVLAIHAEGSLEAQKLTVLMDYDLEPLKRAAARAAGVAASG